MQVTYVHPAARAAWAIGGAPAGLLDPEVNLTYGVPGPPMPIVSPAATRRGLCGFIPRVSIILPSAATC